MEAGQKIREFEQRVMWRKRLLAMQDRFALLLIIGGLLSAALVLYVRLRAIDVSTWAIAAAVFGIVTAVLGALWYMTRARGRDAAFLIDAALELEDRVSSARIIIERGGPEKEVERALLGDAADHIAGKQVSEVVPNRMPQWYGLAAVGLVALGVALFIPQKSLPGGEARAEERASIEMAGEQLEETAREVEEIAPIGTETATLAKEQAELGRALRRSNDTRAEALKKLSALGERIEQRHEELASTRADEIVSLAEKRLGAALSAIRKPPGKSAGKPGAQAASENDEEKLPVTEAPAPGQAERKTGDSPADRQGKEVAGKSGGPPKDGKTRQDRSASEPSAKEGSKQAGAKTKDQAESKPADSPVDSKVQSAGGKPEQAREKQPEKQPTGQKPASDAQKAETEQRGSEGKSAAKTASPPEQGAPGDAPSDSKEDKSKGDQQPQTEQKDSGLFPALSNLPNAVTSAVTEQAAKALPSLSEQLLKKAEQLRAGELKPEDIQQLRQAAEFLARDLSQIAQSKEFQQAVEQMARQINPQQLEQVARQLLSQEKVRRELEAAARLLAQNRQVKEFVAGLERNFNKDQRPGPPGNPGAERGGRDPEPGGRNGPGQNAGGTGNRAQNPEPGDSLKGKGRETRVAGIMERKPGGEYLFLQTKPGTGAARLPYSSAYPQYRRQAERSVERSNVPPHMRSVVRSYFDAINPDGKKQ
ncbi:MAG TPA: hypothetical protein VNH22_02195 [Blastocatellia bacterium]|jgi:hypothetical protein|nr:hypothetical protein [Blastocatellia bacterium]